jgi:predicted nucleic acid-binding protein
MRTAGPALVVDCSAVVDTMFGGSSDRFAALIGTRLLHAPQLIDYEFISTLRRHVTSGLLGASDATEALHLFGDLQIERHSPELMRARIWAMRHKLTAYDASYVALAEALNVPLVTRDLRLARAAEEYCAVVTGE